MPTIPSPVLVITTLLTTRGGHFSNLFYYEAATHPTNTNQMDDIATAFGNIFNLLYANMMNIGGGFSGCTSKFINGSTLLEGNSTGTAMGGALTGQPVTDEVALVIRKVTGLGGPQNRGRFFISGMDSTCFDASANDNELEAVHFLPLAQNFASNAGSDQTLGPAGVCHARHWDRRDNVLRVIAECKVSSRFGSRRDRRRHAPNFAE